MKTTTTFFIALGLFFTIQARAQSNLEITVKNIKEQKGSIRVGLFSNEDDFLKKAVFGKVVKADATEVTVVFENLTPGEYGISVVHDENGNGDLDKNFVGIPKEGFAFGNNAMGSFGPPDFQKAKIKMEDKPQKQVINLIYM
jgi:uncharacterized protein (DUF2141 family)